MPPKSKSELIKLNKELSKNSWKRYLSVLRIVKRSNQEIPNADRIIQLFESGNILGGYQMADALTKQKYLSAAEHFAAHQFANLIRKYPFTGRNPFDPKKASLEKFFLAEDRCKETNLRMTRSLGKYEDKLWRMKNFVRYVLGSSPSRFILDGCDFGPGASIGVHGNATHILAKISASKWSVSPSAVSLSSIAVSRNHQLSRYLMSRDDGYFEASAENFQKKFFERVEICDYNKISFVPKTAKVLRPIAVEPLLNTFIQKGIDSNMRMLLKRVGIDLSDQSTNSDFAKSGSLNWRESDAFSTIDLESASDSVSIELVRHLLPIDWFDLLDRSRSHKFLLDGQLMTYNKFCSMGNGFCFPLETLIFAAICHACGCGRPGTDFLVYGDDIIVRGDKAADVIDTLEAFGFRVNPEKTFCEGPFRESCGRDWFGGVDVRPFILDFELDSLENIIKCYNLSLRSDITSSFFGDTRDFLYSIVPEGYRFVRPVSGSPYGAFEVEFDKFLTSPFARFERNLQCWSWKEVTYHPVSDRHKGDNSQDDILMLAALRGHTSSQPFTFRRKTKTKVRRVCNS